MGKKSLLFLVVVLLGVGGWWLYPRLRPNITNANPSGQTIIALGDSLTAGYGVSPQDSYVRRLEKEFGISILNAGVVGDTTEQGLVRLNGSVLSRKPKVVIVFLGGNDILQQTYAEKTIDRVIENLDAIVTAIQAKGAAVILVGISDPAGRGSLPSRIQSLARKRGTGCVPNALKGVLNDRNLMLPDQIHPNGEGQRIIAERIAKELRRCLPAVFK